MGKYPNIFKQSLRIKYGNVDNEDEAKKNISKSMTKTVINFTKEVSKNMPESLKDAYQDIEEEKY